jgi:DNA polymerase-1
MDSEERIHPLLSAGGTVSFRLSCTEPNAQAVRRDLKIFTAQPGYTLVEFDYSQAELKLGAAYAREKVLADIFFNKEDVHLSTAKLMFGEEEAKEKRRMAKTANFGAFYGGGAPALDNALNCGLEMATHIVNLHRQTFPGVRTASKKAEERWKKRGYVIAAHGKRIYASPMDLQNRIYKAYNALIQSSVAETIRIATIKTAKQMPEVNIVLQVHDSLYVEVPSDDKLQDRILEISEIMRTSGPSNVLNSTDPPIDMVVDHKVVGEGPPLVVTDKTVLL